MQTDCIRENRCRRHESKTVGNHPESFVSPPRRVRVPSSSVSNRRSIEIDKKNKRLSAQTSSSGKLVLSRVVVIVVITVVIVVIIVIVSSVVIVVVIVTIVGRFLISNLKCCKIL